MEANFGWLLLAVKEIGGHGFFRIPAQLFPVVGLGEDAVRQAFSDEPTIGFLGHFKNNRHGRAHFGRKLSPEGEFTTEGP
jgi:hypothetical protein